MKEKYGEDFPLNQIYRLPEDHFIGEGLKSDGPNRNICNLLRILVTGNANTAYINIKDYVTQSPITYDPDLVEDQEDRQCEIKNFSTHESRSNISIKCFKIVCKKDTKQLHRQIRTYNIVRDGELVLKDLEIKLDADSFFKLKNAGIFDSAMPYNSKLHYPIDLSEIPIISSAWANAPVLRLDKLLHNEYVLKNMLCAVRAYAKKVGANFSSRDELDTKLYSREVPDGNQIKTAVTSYGAPIYESTIEYISPASKLFRTYDAKNSIIDLKNPPSKEDYDESQLKAMLRQWLNLNSILKDTRLRIRFATMALEKHGHKIHWVEILRPPRFKEGTDFFEGSMYSIDDKKHIKLIKKTWLETVELYQLE